ncbi:unnamed protein product, partial [Laminaria digitata]
HKVWFNISCATGASWPAMRGSESCSMKRFIAAGTSAVLLLSSAQAGRSPTAGGRLVSGTLQKPAPTSVVRKGGSATGTASVAVDHHSHHHRYGHRHRRRRLPRPTLALEEASLLFDAGRPTASGETTKTTTTTTTSATVAAARALVSR